MLVKAAARQEQLSSAQTAQVRRILRRLGTLWEAPALLEVRVVVNTRLTSTLGRITISGWQIELSPRALTARKRLEEVVTHEGAHAAVSLRSGGKSARPHGTEWRQLMAAAGYPDARATTWRCGTSARPARGLVGRASKSLRANTVFEHWCPVCHTNRTASRPVKAWRCAACSAAGLPGILEITRRTRRQPGPR